MVPTVVHIGRVGRTGSTSWTGRRKPSRDAGRGGAATLLGHLDLLHMDPSKRKSALVAERILEAIRRGEFRPGSRLPSERSIAEQLRVSRGVVREALSALQIAGVLVIRAGDGAFVREAPATSSDRALALLQHSAGPLEIWEARRELEVAVAGLALEKAVLGRPEGAPVELEASALGSAFQEMARCTEAGDVAAYLEANRAFHLGLARLTENSVLIRVMEQLLELTDHVLTRHLTELYLNQGLEASLSKHRAIYEALRKGDEQALRTAVRRHFDELERFLTEGEW